MIKPTQSEINAALTYDEQTGLLTWKDRGEGRSFRRGGKIAGNIRTDGYVHVQINSMSYYAHCLIWCLKTGQWPDSQIDHRDRNRSNNSWSNLRTATPSQNKANIVAINRLGAKGVELLPNGKFRARVRCRGSSYHLGCFEDIESARSAYAKKAVELFGEFARS